MRQKLTQYIRSQFAPGSEPDPRTVRVALVKGDLPGRLQKIGGQFGDIRMKADAIRQIAEFFSDGEVDDEWWELHAEIEIDRRNITIRLNHVNVQEIEWIRKALQQIS